MRVLTAFNQRFYFLVEMRGDKYDLYESPVSSDLFEAMAAYLRFLAIEDDTHRRIDTIKIGAVVGVTENGPWEQVSISPGWRQCEPIVQDIIERVLKDKLGRGWITDYLMDANAELLEQLNAEA